MLAAATWILHPNGVAIPTQVCDFNADLGGCSLLVFLIHPVANFFTITVAYIKFCLETGMNSHWLLHAMWDTNNLARHFIEHGFWEIDPEHQSKSLCLNRLKQMRQGDGVRLVVFSGCNRMDTVALGIVESVHIGKKRVFIKWDRRRRWQRNYFSGEKAQIVGPFKNKDFGCN